MHKKSQEAFNSLRRNSEDTEYDHFQNIEIYTLVNVNANSKTFFGAGLYCYSSYQIQGRL